MSEFPQFFKVNQNNKDQDTFTASSGIGVVENVADYDRTTKWESIGSNDTITEQIEIIFLTVDGVNENRIINRVILAGCNVKSITIKTYFWNGSSFDAPVTQYTTVVNADENLIISFSDVLCGDIKIEMINTITPNEEKRISEFVATQLIWEATMPMDVFNIKNKQKAVIRRLYSGKGQKILHYDKWAAQIEFKQITQIERDALRNIYDNYGSFIIMAEPYDYLDNYDKPEEFYRVFNKISWTQKYFTNIKGAGYNIKFALEEV